MKCSYGFNLHTKYHLYNNNFKQLSPTHWFVFISEWVTSTIVLQISVKEKEKIATFLYLL